MSFSTTDFDQRLRRIAKDHDRLSTGRSRHKIGKDGLIVSRRKWLSMPRFPLKSLLLLAAGFIVFKAVVVHRLGTAAYEERLANLNTENTVDQVGGFLMQLDPATLWVAQQIASFAA